MFVVIGTTTVDLVVRGIPAYAGLGDGFRADNLVFCDEPLLMLMGGNGGNAAYVLGKLGAKTAVCSSIGQDDLGDWLAEKLAAQNVNLAGLIRQPDLATSTSTILLDSDERQSVFHHKGATDALQVTAVHETLFSQAQVLLASSYTLFPHLRAGGFARALQLTHAAGGITALDIGPAIGEPATTAEIAPLFPHLHYLIANVHELLVCTGERDWETAVAQLLTHGCPCVVVKRGAEGVALRSRQFNADVPALPVTANISIGAGDAFNAGFLYSLQTSEVFLEINKTDPHPNPPPARGREPDPLSLEGEGRGEGERDLVNYLKNNETSATPPHLLKALRFGTVTAALVVGGQRGVLSAPTLAQVEALLHE